VRVVLDKSQRDEKSSVAGYLFDAGIPVWVDAKYAIAHNKVMIVDGAIVITGSFNFTMEAETSNAENLLVIRNVELAARYGRNFLDHLSHSEVYKKE
jgi:phosphatidylserine/phosphatidylglycerophosphate/cardiolipin synthase-like enzyme